MKYAIYDKAADGYLTKMEFEMGYSDNTQFECGLNEYITEAKLLDTPKEAADAIARIESFKFMEKGRFVMHSFDDELNDQYIISEAGTPTKVVDNITVDLDGTINVKYGTMTCHWSTKFLIRAITRLNALQKAARDIYTPWCSTFDVYKVITVIDEREHTHYQFINVTEKGCDSAIEENHLNNRIEELEKANYELGKKAAACGATANRLQEENDDLKTKVESIKKEARNWKKMYESASEARELNKNRCVCDSGEVSKAIANNIIDICEADDKFDVTLKKFSELYKAVNTIYDCDNDSILYAFKSVLEIFTALESQVRNIIDENVVWKNKAMKAVKDLNDQKRLNKVNSDTIDRMVVEKRAMNKEIKELRDTRGSIAAVMFVIRNAICNNNSGAFGCIEFRMEHDSIFNSSPFMAGVRDNIKDICTAEKKNIANHDLKNSEIARLTNEKERALERAEFYKRMANSVYGISIPGRCCGKQMTADVITGKKILVDKEKYDDLMECVNNISLTYEMMNLTPFSMDRPSWLSGIINRINNLTK